MSLHIVFMPMSPAFIPCPCGHTRTYRDGRIPHVSATNRRDGAKPSGVRIYSTLTPVDCWSKRSCVHTYWTSTSAPRYISHRWVDRRIGSQYNIVRSIRFADTTSCVHIERGNPEPPRDSKGTDACNKLTGGMWMRLGKDERRYSDRTALSPETCRNA